MTRPEHDARTQPARNALKRLEAALAGKNAADRDAAFREVMEHASSLGSPWPRYSAWSLMQKYRKTLQPGELLDLWQHNKLPAEQFLTRFVHVVWDHINILEGGGGAADNETADWLSFWITVRDRANSASGGAQQNALDESDALLELITRLFSAVYPDPCASDVWVEDLREQAIAHAQYARCHVNPDNPLSLADDNQRQSHLLAMSRALGAVMRPRLYTEVTTLEAATAQLAALPQGDRLGDAKQVDRMGRVLRYWASLDTTVAYILERRFGTVLGASVKHEERIIPWVKGIEQGIALVGPPQAGKTSLMFASEYVTADLVPDLPNVRVRHAQDDEADIKAKRSQWKRREERFNTQQSAKLSAQTDVSGLCSFGFFDLSGEEYFPQWGDAVPNREVIRRRYATSPPSVVAMIFKSDGDPAKIGSAFDDLMQTVGQTAQDAAGSAATVQALNSARPVYFLIGKVDLIVARQTSDEEQETLLAHADIDDRLVTALSAQLSDEVIDLRSFGPGDDSAVAEDLEIRIRNNAEMCKTPGRLRAVIDALELTRAQRIACGATGHTNLRLLFVQCGAAPGGKAEFPPVLGVDTFWRDLWEKVPTATAEARGIHLRQGFVDKPTDDLKNARELARHAESVRIPPWPVERVDKLMEKIKSRSKALADEILSADQRQLPLDKFSASREWTRESLDLLIALDHVIEPYRAAQKGLDTATCSALHELLVSLGTVPDKSVNELEGFTTAEPVTEGLSGQVAKWRGDFSGRDIDANSFMFHGAVGALRGSSPLRSEPTEPFEANPALAWLATGDTLERRLSEIFGDPADDQSEGVEAETLITRGLELLANYKPRFGNLAVELLEFDRTKVEALQHLAGDLANVQEHGIKTILALRQLVVDTTRAPTLETRITEATTLAMLSAVVRELGFDPVKLLAAAGEGGSAVQTLADAAEQLIGAKNAATTFELPFTRSKKKETVAKALNSAWSMVADYAAPVRPKLSPDPNTADAAREQRRFAFVHWYTQELSASTIVKDRDLGAKPSATAAKNAAITAVKRAAAFEGALRGYVEGLRVVILKERDRYLKEGKLFEQLPQESRQQLNQLFQQSYGADPDPAEREALLREWETTYFKAIRLALEMQPK